jgi:hypothetical protein
MLILLMLRTNVALHLPSPVTTFRNPANSRTLTESAQRRNLEFCQARREVGYKRRARVIDEAIADLLAVGRDLQDQ